MAFNLTGTNVELYFSVNAAIHAGIFTFTALPAFMLCLLSVVALFFAHEINWPMRVLIINILAAEIIYWVAFAFQILGFLPRAFIGGEGNVSCVISICLAFVSSLLKFSSVALYAIKVYIFIQYGTKKLKWGVIIPYIVISWILSVALGTMPIFSIIFNPFVISVNNGFCFSDPNSPFFRAYIAVAIFIIIILLSITLVFSLLTYCYVKKNHLNNNVEIKKEVAKNLYYFAIASIFTLIYNVAPAASSPIKTALRDQGIIATIIVNYYVFQVLISLPSVISPIMAIIILKPLRLAMKQGISKCCCRMRAEVPA